MSAKPITQVRVTNRNEKPFSDMFDSESYMFQPNEPVEIPIGAAVHIFGFMWHEGDEQYIIAINKNHVVARWGLNTPTTMNQADAFLKNIELKALRFKLQEVSDEGALPPPRDAAPEPEEVLEDVELLPVLKTGKAK